MPSPCNSPGGTTVISCIYTLAGPGKSIGPDSSGSSWRLLSCVPTYWRSSSSLLTLPQVLQAQVQHSRPWAYSRHSPDLQVLTLMLTLPKRGLAYPLLTPTSSLQSL